MSVKYFLLLCLIFYCSSGLNANPVQNAEARELFSQSDCNLPHTWGPVNCLAYIERYHWNNTVKKCEKIIYGGCRATKNNFASLQECESTANPVCVTSS
ncbi:hypothetical protein ABEB36_003321 [Hypothenemus hampei]|uniref:BPTI/Kunitz inhibitor domain-containing protein n=1 Tax=Hypothenemus hampei TaxID=57062 RepID=A0ABD1F8R8_HYPHA